MAIDKNTPTESFLVPAYELHSNGNKILFPLSFPYKPPSPPGSTNYNSTTAVEEGPRLLSPVLVSLSISTPGHLKEKNKTTSFVLSYISKKKQRSLLIGVGEPRWGTPLVPGCHLLLLSFFFCWFLKVRQPHVIFIKTIMEWICGVLSPWCLTYNWEYPTWEHLPFVFEF